MDLGMRDIFKIRSFLVMILKHFKTKHIGVTGYMKKKSLAQNVIIKQRDYSWLGRWACWRKWRWNRIKLDA